MASKKPKAPKQPPAAAQQPEAKQSKYQSFVTETLHRSALTGAPYNPRILSADAKRRLKASLQKVGLVQPIVWNRQTGHVVGGHQRLAQLDALEGTENYTLTVAVLDVDETREKEINILLNNTLVSGDWDYEELKAVLNSEGLDLEATGFDMTEAMKLFGDDKHARNEILNEINDSLNSVKDSYDRMHEALIDKDDVDFYCVVVFESSDQRREFLESVEFEENRYVHGGALITAIQKLRAGGKDGSGGDKEAGVADAGDGTGEDDGA